MAIDSAGKRFSIMYVGCPWRPLAMVPSGSVTGPDRQEFLYYYRGITWEEPSADPITPTDDDADTTVTSRIDVDGATVRPPRTTLFHAMDSARNASLIGPDRLPMDRYKARSVRTGRLPTKGHHSRLFMFTSRAGEGLATRDVVVKYDVVPVGQRLKTDTTNRTGADGETLRVGSTRVFHAANSARNADLNSVSTDRDRFFTRHQLPSTGRVGGVHRLLLTHDGRAGNAWCPEEIVIRLSTTEETGRAKAT